MSPRYGLLYSDGSINVLPEGTDLFRARDERDACDDGPHSYPDRTRIVHVHVSVLSEIVERPDGAEPVIQPVDARGPLHG